ncbi:MAG: hypothetical protein JRE63_06480 [Deltaproteobacteria bacterium]|jgi:hypothetical protein|nr:hypothetical protein [Deltaproteobacteria bacterium]
MDFSTAIAGLWIIAGALSISLFFRFPRIWSNIALGFILIPCGEIILLNGSILPRLENNYILTLGHVLGMVAMLAISSGIHEYYIFTRSLDCIENRPNIVVLVIATLLGSMLFLVVNPHPDEAVRDAIRIAENTIWICLSLININLLRKIYLTLKDAPIAGAFRAFLVLFLGFLLWKGSQLYMDVYQLKQIKGLYAMHYQIMAWVHLFGGVVSSLSAVFIVLYLKKVMR